MKENIEGLCGDCLNLSKRVLKTHIDWDYKFKGQGYAREYSCLKGHKVWAHQVTTKCSHHRPRKKVALNLTQDARGKQE